MHDASAALLLPQLLLQGCDVVVFIDNLSFCTDAQLERFLHQLLFHPSAKLSFLLSSNSPVALDMARAKLELGALELGVQHLGLDQHGVTELLAASGAKPISAAQAQQIVTQTEGWPAAVRLLQVLIQSSGDATEQSNSDLLVSLFGGDNEDVARMLTRRVLIGLAPEQVVWMMEMALVRDFCVDLATEMTGKAESEQWLAQLVERNVLIFPLDRSRRHFRFHTLLAEFLQAEGRERLNLTHRNKVLSRAARWHERQGNLAEAIDLALDGDWVDHALAMLSRFAPEVVGTLGRMSVMIHWVDRLMAKGVVLDASLHAWYVWALCDSLQYERAAIALETLDARIQTDNAFNALGSSPQLQLRFSRLLVSVWMDRTDEAYEQASQYLREGGRANALNSLGAFCTLAFKEMVSGSIHHAREWLQEAHVCSERSGSAYGQAWYAIFRACLEINYARPNVADALLRETRARLLPLVGPSAGLVVTADLVRARALIDQGLMEEGRQAIERSLAFAVNHGVSLTLEQALAAAMALWDGQDDSTHSLNALHLDKTLEYIAYSYPGRARLLYKAAKTRRLVQLGRLLEAVALAQQIGTIADAALDGPTPQTLPERGDLLLAKLELMQADRLSQNVLSLLETAINSARADGRSRDEVELQLLLAITYQRMTKPRAAQRHLALAIELAAHGNLTYPFEMRRAALAAVLGKTNTRNLGLTDSVQVAFAERLNLRAANALDADASTTFAETANGEPSPRDIELLLLIDQGLSNEQIADRLHIAVATVKWHLHNLYGKLGVRSRSAAVARGLSLKWFARRH